MRLSLAMIARNEHRTIGRALESASSFCDEFVVVDTGSTDATRVTAEEHGATVHELAWTDDFGAARNASFDLCHGEWIVWLDADDVVPASSRYAFADVKAALTDELDVIVAPYHYRLAPDGSPLLTFHRERLIRRAAGLRWEGRVHERIRVPPGRSALRSQLEVEHRPEGGRGDGDRTLTILSAMVAEGDRSPRTLFHLANELYDHGRFGEAVESYRDYLAADPSGADRYWASLYLAEALVVLEDPDGARAAALGAIGENGGRAEAYVLLGRMHYGEEEWDDAIPLFVAAAAARRPRFGYVRDPDYSYAPWDYLAVCYEKLGRLDEALAAARRALEGNPQADRVRSNMHWLVDNL